MDNKKERCHYDMRRTNLAVLMLGIAAISLCSCTCVRVRPVTLLVVDRETKAPLANIPVYYGIESVREEPEILFIIPNPYPVSYKIEKGEKAFTDTSGRVSFGPSDFLLRKTQRINGELIYINIDLNEKTRRSRFKVNLHDSRNVVETFLSFGTGFSRLFLTNPVAGYRGVFVFGTEDTQEQNKGPDKGEVADIISNTGGLSEKEQFLTIELGRD